MASHRIVFTPEAHDQLDSLHVYISTAADVEIASRFVDGIINHVATLSDIVCAVTNAARARRAFDMPGSASSAHITPYCGIVSPTGCSA